MLRPRNKGDEKMVYEPKTYRTNGGDKHVIASGGEFDVESGGALKIAGTQVTATAAQLNTTKIDSASVLFTEAGAGTYTGTVAIPAGSVIVDVIVHAIALWDAVTSAVLKVGDVADDDGFFTAVNLKATDLLAAESISFAHTGGKEGADVDSPAAGAHVRRRYLAAARSVSGIVTSVGAGTAGRTLMTVIYTTPSAAAATKA